MAKKTYEIDEYTSDTIAYGSVHVFKGVPPAKQAQLEADMREAAGHGRFVVVFLDAKGAATVTGDAKMHEAIAAAVTDKAVGQLVDRAEAHFVERVQPVLAVVQTAQS